MSKVSTDVLRQKFNEVRKRDDLRGEWEESLTPALVYALGDALARLCAAEKEEALLMRVITGRDARLSGESIEQFLTAGLRNGAERAGRKIEVFSLGICPTELVTYTAVEWSFDYGIMITASHNPPNQNGLKIVTCGGNVLSGYQFNQLGKMLAETRPDPPREIPPAAPQNIWESYRRRVLQITGLAKGLKEELKVAVEAGFGVGGITMRKIWAGIPGLTLMLSNEQPNGFFPLGVPDPLLERTMERTQKLAEVTKAALSLAFDGDADRIGAVINTLALTPTELGALIAEELIRKSSVSAPAVLYTIACSKLVSEVIRKAGGRAVMGPVGYGHLRARMQKMTDCIFALEHSGHMIYREFFGADCGMVSAGMIFRLVARQPDIAKRVRQWRQQYHISKEESFSLASQEAITSLINELESDFSAQGKRVEMYAPGEPVPPNILRVELAASGKNFPAWFLVRPSGNEPLVRLMAEVIIPRTNPAEIEVKQARRQLDELLRTLRQKIKNAACRDAS